MLNKQQTIDLQPLRSRFGANLREAREDAGLTRGELAKRSSVDAGGIRKMEDGLQVPRIDTLASLGMALGVQPTDLLRGIKWVVPTERQPGSFELD